MQFEMAGAFFLISSSIGTGAMFSPPAPMMSSLYLPAGAGGNNARGLIATDYNMYACKNKSNLTN